MEPELIHVGDLGFTKIHFFSLAHKDAHPFSKNSEGKVTGTNAELAWGGGPAPAN